MDGSPSVTHAQPGLPGEGGVPPAAEPVVQDTPVHLGDLIIGPEATHWSRLLIQDHLDSAAKRALLGTCTSARDLVLGTAKHATFQWDIANQASSVAGWQAALATRGKLRTTLRLTASESGLLSDAAEALQESTTWLDSLHVQCGGMLPAAVLATIGRRCPNLRALDVGSLVDNLPCPQRFPKLKQLSIHVPINPINHQKQQLQTILRTTSPYIKQLTSLILNAPWGDGPEVTALLFSPDNVGTHLNTLHLSTTLNDTLLGTILQSAPVLEELGVLAIQLESDAHTHTQTQWQRLQVMRRHVDLSDLVRLPHSPGLQIIGRPRLRLYCDITSNEEAVAVAQLSAVHLSKNGPGEVFVQPGKDYGYNLAVADQPAAMRVALSLLRSERHNKQQCIVLEGWVMSPELMHELPGLPGWGKLQLRGTWVYEQPSYAPLLSLLPGSYCDVIIGVLGLSREQVEGVCLGAPQNRTPEAPLRIRLRACDPVVVSAIRHKMQLGSFPRVSVERY